MSMLRFKHLSTSATKKQSWECWKRSLNAVSFQLGTGNYM
ncbi:unnamed protein product [Ixodes pacificus]